MIFIDLQNVLISVETMGPPTRHINFENLARTLTGSRRLMAAHAFDSIMPAPQEDPQRPFHDKLRYLGYRVHVRESSTEEGRKQKEVDVDMACEMVVQAFMDNYDVAILVSGDRDFLPALLRVQGLGKRVETAAFTDSMSEEMRRYSDRFHDLSGMDLLYQV